MEKKTPRVSAETALIIAVVSGLILGKLIKKFSFGLLLGVFISLLYVLISTSKKRN